MTHAEHKAHRFAKMIFPSSDDARSSFKKIRAAIQNQRATSFSGGVLPIKECGSCSSTNLEDSITVVIFAAPQVRQVIAVAVPVCDACAAKIERGATNSPEFARAARAAQASLGAEPPGVAKPMVRA